jgi:uncharacterized protein YoxC
MVLLGVLLVLAILADILLYILLLGVSSRSAREIQALKSENVQLRANVTTLFASAGDIGEMIPSLVDGHNELRDDIKLLAGNISDVRDDIGDINQDITALQRAAAARTDDRPVVAAAVSTTNKGGRPRKVG